MSTRHLKGYYNLMDSAQRKNSTRDRKDGYYEMHHIIPKSFGGSDVDSNKVLLTAKEHYIAHYLLTKFTSHGQKRKMVKAFDAMGMNGKGQKGNRHQTCRLFEKNRIGAAKAHSVMMTGKKQKPEHIEKRRKSNTGKVRSPEAIENYKKSTVFKTMKFNGSDNHKTNTVDFFNQSGELMFTSSEGIVKFLRSKGMPISAFMASYQKGGIPLYENTTPKERNVKYKGWVAKIRKETNEKI